MTHEQARERMARRFTEGAVPPLEEQALRAHLRGCAECRSLYDQYSVAEATLDGDPDTPPVAQLDRMLAEGPRLPSRSRSGVWWALGAAAAAAMAMWLVLTPRATGDGFVARGGDAGASAGIRVFTARDGRTQPAERGLRSTDGLLFAYSIERGAPYRFLAINGRDAAGQVHWFHPAYERPEDAPRSIPVEVGVADRELPEAVYVKLAPGPLEVCGLFTIEALDVKVVDGWLVLDVGPWPKAHHACVKLEVTP